MTCPVLLMYNARSPTLLSTHRGGVMQHSTNDPAVLSGPALAQKVSYCGRIAHRQSTTPAVV